MSPSARVDKTARMPQGRVWSSPSFSVFRFSFFVLFLFLASPNLCRRQRLRHRRSGRWRVGMNPTQWTGWLEIRGRSPLSGGHRGSWMMVRLHRLLLQTLPSCPATRPEPAGPSRRGQTSGRVPNSRGAELPSAQEINMWACTSTRSVLLCRCRVPDGVIWAPCASRWSAAAAAKV